MSVIRPLKPREQRHVCPDCAAPEGLFIDLDKKITCKLCGWKDKQIVSQVSMTKSPVSHDDIRDIRNFKVSYFLSNSRDISTWGRAAYDSALEYIKQKKWEEAVTSLKRALDNDPDFLEAHLWLGRLLNDEKQQRDHISHVIAFQPQHAEALLELMYLNGQISLTQLEQAQHNYGDIEVKQASSPVQSATVITACPICSGDMTTHPITGHVECAFCGHIEEADNTQGVNIQSLTGALLQQRVQGVKWLIGEHIMHCNNCGAERTLPQGKMVSQCAYCGSNHVIQKDALNSFRQPDGLIPFTVSQDRAEAVINERLSGTWERFKGLFSNNKVKQALFEGSYLPFWLFDIVMDAKITYKEINDSAIAYPVASSRSVTMPEMYNNYPLPAVLSPSPKLIDKISHYDFSTIQTYDPQYLTRYPADLYVIDFDKASLEARGRVSRIIRQLYMGETNPLTNEEISHIGIMISNIQFRLVLLPVWIATLIEDDGDVRVGLVNGQTGQAVLGKARKPEKFA